MKNKNYTGKSFHIWPARLCLLGIALENIFV